MRAGRLRFAYGLVVASIVLSSTNISAQSGAGTAGDGTAAAPANSASNTGGRDASSDSSQVRQVGGGVSAPVVVYQTQPQYSEEARRQKISGTVIVNLRVDEQGNPTNVHVIHGVGLGLDENAVEAVKQYKFKPAMEDGKPVAVDLNVKIEYKIFDKKPYESDPHYVAAMADAKKLGAAGNVDFAIDAYKKANKIAGGKCAECLRRMIELNNEAARFKDAAATAAELASIAEGQAEKSQAEMMRGQALYSAAGDKPKPAQLQAADDALKAAIADDPKDFGAHYIDGMVLARMGQIDAARAEFEATLAQASPNDPAYLRAQHFAANPAISYAKMVPAFTVTALDGSKFTLDAMGGRVVLIDFWATWCGPCNEELPQMKRIAKEFAGQPLVILSVSWDSDETKWKEFIAKNEMTWMQYRDANHELSKEFGVDAIPHYFTVDADGVLTSEMLGSGSDVEGKLRKLVAKARAAQVAKKEPTAMEGPAATGN